MNRFAMLAGLVGVTALAVACSPGTVSSHLEAGEFGSAVRDAFNRDADRARILLIVSPTCGHCLLGASPVGGAIENLQGTVPVYVV